MSSQFPASNVECPVPLARSALRVRRSKALAILIAALVGRLADGETAPVPQPGLALVLSGCEPDYPPYCIVTSDKQADGFSVELLRAALKAMGREVVFKTGPWAELKQELADGKLEVLPLVGRTPEREALYDFSVPYLTMHGALFIRRDTTNIRTWEDVKGKRVAVMKGDNAEEFVRRVHLTDRILTSPSFEGVFQMLADGRADAVIAQKRIGISLLKHMGITSIQVVGTPNEEFTQTFCFAVRKGNGALLSTLNEGLAIVMAEGINWPLERKWMGADAREAALARVLIYGGDRAFPPYEFLDEKGHPSGFNIDLARAIARQIGVDISFQLAPWTEVRRKIENGEVDLACMFYSASRARLVEFAVPHTLVYQAVFARNDAPPYRHLEDLKGRRISVQNGDIMHEYAVEHGLGDTLTVAATSEEALALLEKGRTDYALGTYLQGLYWIKKNGWNNLQAIETRLLETDYGYAVPKGNTALRDLFNDGLRQLKETGEYRGIYNKWLGVLEPDFDRRRITRNILLLLVAASLLAAIAIGIIFTLRRQVAKRTQALQQEMLQTRVRTAAMEAASEAMVITDRNAVVLWINPAFAAMTGYTAADIIGQPASILMPDQQSAAAYRDIQKALSAGKVWRGELLDRRKDGSLYPEEVSITPVCDEGGVMTHQIAIKRDITERRRMEAQHRQEQNLISIGALARGMAHEINNPIMGIANYAQLIKDRAVGNAALAEFADEILAESKRVARMTHSLLDFTQQGGTQEMAPVALTDIVTSVLAPFEEAARQRSIALSCDIPADLPAVVCCKNRIGQVVTALVANAMDAWGEGPLDAASPATMQGKRLGGEDKKITISAREMSLVIGHSLLGNGSNAQSPMTNDADRRIRAVRLTVADNGPGIAAEIRERVFEPFFTTKDRTRHSGLGLWISRSIVQDHGGQLSVESPSTALRAGPSTALRAGEVGRGAQFHVELPVAQEPPDMIRNKVAKAR